MIETARELADMLTGFGHGPEEETYSPVFVTAIDTNGRELEASANVISWASCLRSVWAQRQEKLDTTAALEVVVHHNDWHHTGQSSVPGRLRLDSTGVELMFALQQDFRDEISLGPAQPKPDGPLDSGKALLLSITPIEIATIEPILAEIWAALDRGLLSESQRHQIVAMAELIRTEQLAAVVGETERWKLVGSIRAALKYLAKEAPRDALAWWKLIELLEKIDWSTLANELSV